MVMIWLILSILLITAFIWMSNSIHNWPPVRSTLYLEFLEKLIHRHVVASPVIFVMLFATPKLMGIIGILIDIVFLIVSGLWLHQTVAADRQHQQYINSLKPNYPCKCSRIWITPQMARKLGGKTINYMFFCPQTQVITFPESKYHNQRKYYLLNVNFKPKYGPNYERLTYTGRPFTRRSLFKNPKTAGKSFTEIPTVATATLESIQTSRKIRIRLHDEISDRIKRLRNDVYQAKTRTI